MFAVSQGWLCGAGEFGLPLLLMWGGRGVCASPQYGDYDPNVHKRGFLAQEELLPKRVRSSAASGSWCPGYPEAGRAAGTCLGVSGFLAEPGAAL